MFQKFFIATSFGSTLKLPIRIKFSYCPSCESKFLPIQFRWLTIKFFWRLEELQRSHFFFLNLFSTKNPSIDKSVFSNLTEYFILYTAGCYHQLHFCLICMGLYNEIAKWNCNEEKKESIFVSHIKSISAFLLIICCRVSNLYRRKFMLSCAKIRSGLGRAPLLRFDGIWCGSLKIWSPRTDLWPESRKESDWLTS